MPGDREKVLKVLPGRGHRALLRHDIDFSPHLSTSVKLSMDVRSDASPRDSRKTVI
jgi:hypothetical protein